MYGLRIGNVFTMIGWKLEEDCVLDNAVVFPFRHPEL